MDNKFYMCHVSGSGGAKRKHETLAEAEQEAKRLSELPHNRNKDVFVLEPVATYRVAEGGKVDA